MSSNDLQQLLGKNGISWGQVGPRSRRLLVRGGPQSWGQVGPRSRRLLVRGGPQSSRMGEDLKRNISRHTELFGVSKPKRSMKRNRNSSIKKSKMKKNAREVILGFVPGVEVGDEFQNKKKLSVVGLHGQVMRGIDYVACDGMTLAVSVVSSGTYDDKLENKNLLTYIGEGGNLNKYKNGATPKDQKLERGNLALKNSSVAKNPVRVILKCKSKDGSRDVFVYYGIYEVDNYCRELGLHGNYVYKFKLRRKLDQPQVIGNELKKSQPKVGLPHVIDHDLSNGTEVIPIYVVNDVDGEKRPFIFEYTPHMVYPGWYKPIPPVGCGCVDGCSNSNICSCAKRNGGKFPFNKNKGIVKPKPLIYECGPHCICPPTCRNRVSQNGIQFRFEVFKTKDKGWGVRSRDMIPNGSFICEYTGMLINFEEAEKRADNDEYLFDLWNYNGDTTKNKRSKKRQSSSANCFDCDNFTIDAAHIGNIGRFINHSCSPNLIAQKVLYDHRNKNIPHMVLFATGNIPPMKELTYNYHYKMDQVQDSYGNIRKKACLCGALECSGRMYRQRTSTKVVVLDFGFQ